MNKNIGLLPSLGDYSSRTEWEAACWEKIIKSEELLRTIVTEHEIHDLIMRAAALEGIASGKSYRQIGKELSISQQTVSAAKKALTENKYRSYPERGKKERKKKIYSTMPSDKKSKWRDRHLFTRRVRTKYGILHMPY